MVRLVVQEALLLGGGGALLALAAGVPLVWRLAHTGLDFRRYLGSELRVPGRAASIRSSTATSAGGSCRTCARWRIGATIVASLYPAWFAARTDPAVALAGGPMSEPVVVRARADEGLRDRAPAGVGAARRRSRRAAGRVPRARRAVGQRQDDAAQSARRARRADRRRARRARAATSRALSKHARAQMRLHSIGFVFQAYNLVPVLTARENVEFVLELQGVGRGAARARASRCSTELGLGDLADRRIERAVRRTAAARGRRARRRGAAEARARRRADGQPRRRERRDADAPDARSARSARHDVHLLDARPARRRARRPRRDAGRRPGRARRAEAGRGAARDPARRRHARRPVAG